MSKPEELDKVLEEFKKHPIPAGKYAAELGVCLGVVYALRVVQKDVFFGPAWCGEPAVKDALDQLERLFSEVMRKTEQDALCAIAEGTLFEGNASRRHALEAELRREVTDLYIRRK